MKKPLDYKAAGVDIDAADRLIRRVRTAVRGTFRPEVVGDLGGFGGLFALPPGKYREPVLVSGTDGVGTKLKIAFLTGRHDTIGIDLVAMCVNDIAVHGAEPLFFLDYFATGKLDEEAAASVIEGIAAGCRQAGCALIGGETAEMPGFYPSGEYDLAGFAVGVVEREKIVTGETVAPGDAILGIASSGLHSNGFSLARQALLERARLPLDAPPPGLHAPLGEVLLTPTRIYARSLGALLARVPVKGLAHITGGGLPGNVPRAMPDRTRAVLHTESWARPPVFDLLQREGAIEAHEMYRVFNCGIGMTVIVSADRAREAAAVLEEAGEQVSIIGEVEAGEGPPSVTLLEGGRAL
ncbi:MAG: phosphoribosylformylglycinamidine cyclo-ligase [Deltaproteobacteria bacterium]|nr:phosphoribosylformylglycinamidine cyclo-ligase [Deltaproteobacteria bacterium]